MRELLKQFDEIIVPWVTEEKLSLHNAFEISRMFEPEKYEILSKLYRTLVGQTYLKEYFKTEKPYK